MLLDVFHKLHAYAGKMVQQLELDGYIRVNKLDDTDYIAGKGSGAFTPDLQATEYSLICFYTRCISLPYARVHTQPVHIGFMDHVLES